MIVRFLKKGIFQPTDKKKKAWAYWPLLTIDVSKAALTLNGLKKGVDYVETKGLGLAVKGFGLAVKGGELKVKGGEDEEGK